MVACKVTFEFYNLSSNGLIAHKELSETVDVFGCSKKDILTEDGKQVQERFELLLLVEMGLTPADIEQYDYHTVECVEHDVPDDFLDDIMQNAEEYEDDEEDNSDVGIEDEDDENDEES